MASNRNRVKQVLKLLRELGGDSLPGPPAVGNLPQDDADPADRLAESVLRQALAESPIDHVLRGHNDWVTSAAYAPDGSVILTAGNDATARFWDPGSGLERRQLKLPAPSRFYSGRPQFSADGTRVLIATVDGRVHVGDWEGDDGLIMLAGDHITRAAISPDGDVVFAGLEDNTALLWLDVAGAPIALGSPAGVDEHVFVSTVAVSANGRYVAAGSSDGLVRIWPVRARPGPPIVLLGPGDYVNTVTFGMNDQLVAAASDDHRGYLWRWGSSPTPTVLEGHVAEVNHITLSRDGRRAATAGVDKVGRVWTDGGVSVAVLAGYHDELLDVAFSLDEEGSLVAAASADGTAAIFDVATGRRLLTIRAHSGTVFTAQFAPDGSRFVTASADTTARTWRVAPGRTFRGHQGPVNSAVFDSEGERALTAGDDCVVRLWEVATGKELKTLRVHRGPVNAACFSPDDRLVATAGIEGIAYLWNPQSTSPPAAISIIGLGPPPWIAGTPENAPLIPSTQAYDYGIISVDFSPDGQRLLVATRRELSIWQVRDQQFVDRFPLVEPGSDHNPFEVASGASFSPDGSYILTAQLDKTARLRKASDGTVIRELGEDPASSYPDAVYSAVFNEEGDRVVAANADGTARVWKVADGTLVIRLVGLWGQLRSAAFSRSGRLVAAGDVTGRLHVWRVDSGQLVMIDRIHALRVNSVMFSPDDKSVLTSSDDGTVRYLDVEEIPTLPDLMASAGSHIYGDTWRETLDETRGG
jgi:WD40 repeat protein